MKRLFDNFWVCDFPLNSGENKSFGKVTAKELLLAMQHNLRNLPQTELQKWISENGYLKTMPPELYYKFDTSAFIRILAEYNGGGQNCRDFLSKPDGFYLWLRA